jgi:hypothetical protein
MLKALLSKFVSVGTIITVLDKNPSAGQPSSNPSLWTGVRDDSGVVGLFSPSQTVAYVNTMPTTSSSSSTRKWQRAGTGLSSGGGPSGSDTPVSESILSVFQRGSYRSLSRSSRGKLSRDMISGPRGQVQVCGTFKVFLITFKKHVGFSSTLDTLALMGYILETLLDSLTLNHHMPACRVL